MTRPQKALGLASSVLLSALRGGVGVAARPARLRPQKLLELYEFEGCPYCRLVREALTELDIDAAVFPCPKGGTRFRRSVIERGGKAQFPFLVDPNCNIELYESADILRHLFTTYAQRRPPLHWRVIELQAIGSSLAGLIRPGMGVRCVPSRPPRERLTLFSYESNPHARPVRERLSAYELPYVLRSTGLTYLFWPSGADKAPHESHNRAELARRAGAVSVPYLIDPNTATELGDPAAIVDYLDRTYRV